MRLPKRSFVFYMEIQIFTVVPKRPFLVLQGNTKFCSCIQTAIHFFIAKRKFLRTIPKRSFAFLPRNTEF